MIRGGLEYGLGIYVTGVDKDSVADRAGLLVRITFLHDALQSGGNELDDDRSCRASFQLDGCEIIAFLDRRRRFDRESSLTEE